MRLTAPELSERYRAGLLGEGANVLDAGQVGTEMLYYLVGSRELDGGLMCTASHNPKAYTGAKLVREGAIALSGDTGIQDIRRMIESGADREVLQRRLASSRSICTRSSTRRPSNSSTRRSSRPLKVVVDGGNGMAGPVAGPLLERLGLDLIETCWTPDGNFPEHEPNPLLPENRQFIIDRVLSAGADLGIAWDGDADRCFFIDETGRFVDGDFLTALLAESLLRKDPIPPAPRRSSMTCAPRAPSRTPSRAPAARRTSTASATRSSRRGCARRARCSAARSPGTTTSATSTARTRARSRRCSCSSCSRAAASRCRSCSSPTARATSSPARSTPRSPTPPAKMAEIAARYPDAEQKQLDGISIDYPDWHFNVRSSNTEPLLRLCLESLVSPEDMERRRDEVLDLIRS